MKHGRAVFPLASCPKNSAPMGIYNGDIGMIEDVDLDEGEVAVDYDGRTVTFAYSELDTPYRPMP